MNPKATFFSVFFISLLFFLPLQSAQADEIKKCALVIGNGSYKDAPLLNPVNDANDLAYIAKKIGFTVKKLIDCDQREIENGIGWLGNKLRTGGIGLFYFAGHGIQVNGRNYLIPIDANIHNELDVKYEAVDAGRVISQMDNAGNKGNIIILDACRSNPFTRNFRSYTKGLASMEAPSGSMLAYSMVPGKVASDGTQRNSLYTASLMRHIQTPNLEIQDVFEKIKSEVVSKSKRNQTPWNVSSLPREFYFVSTNQYTTYETEEIEGESTYYYSTSGDSEVAVSTFTSGDIEVEESTITSGDSENRESNYVDGHYEDDLTIIVTSDAKGEVYVNDDYKGIFRKNWFESSTKQIIVTHMKPGAQKIELRRGSNVEKWNGVIEHSSFIGYKNGSFDIEPIYGPEGYWKVSAKNPDDDSMEKDEYIHIEMVGDRFTWFATGTDKYAVPYTKNIYLLGDNKSNAIFYFPDPTYCLRGGKYGGMGISDCTHVEISEDKMEMAIFSDRQKRLTAYRIDHKKKP